MGGTELLNTKGQRQSPAWWRFRAVRLTASGFYDILQHEKWRDEIKKQAAAPSNVRKRKIPVGILKKYQKKRCEETTGNAEFPSYSDLCKQYGIYYEETGLRAVQRWLGDTGNIQQCGIFQSPDYPFIAATPDGVIKNKDGRVTHCVEIKCPYSSRFSCKPPSYLKASSLTKKWILKQDSRYYAQVQGEIHCTGADICLFAVWTPSTTYVAIVQRDQQYIQWMLSRLTTYFCEVFFPNKLAEEDEPEFPPEFHSMVNELKAKAASKALTKSKSDF